MLFSILVVLASSISLKVVSSDYFRHYTPDSDQAELSFWMENETGFMNVTLFFAKMCYKIDSWGTLVVDSNDFSVNSEMWEWMGYCAPAEWSAEHIYDLGQLDEGVYSFSFCCWRNPVKSVVFEVGFPADINDDGRVEMRDIGTAARAFGTHNPDPDWNPDADIYRDGTVDMIDIGFTAKHFGEIVP